MTKKVNKLKTSYYSPTPIKWRRLGDACLLIALLVGQSAQLSAYPIVGTITTILGIVGKFLTNFMTDEKITIPDSDTDADNELQDSEGSLDSSNKGQSKDS